MNLQRLQKAFLPLLLTIIGCASGPQAVYLNNEPIPGRVYTLQSTGAPISATALFYVIQSIEDLDGKATRIAYVPLNENLKFSRTEFLDLVARVSITNPTKVPYTVKYFSRILYNDGSNSGQHVVVGKSFLDQRTFTISIPVPVRMLNGAFDLIVEDQDAKELLRIGTLKYEIHFPHVSVPTRREGSTTKK